MTMTARGVASVSASRAARRSRGAARPTPAAPRCEADSRPALRGGCCQQRDEPPPAVAAKPTPVPEPAEPPKRKRPQPEAPVADPPAEAPEAETCVVCHRTVRGGTAGMDQHARSAYHLAWVAFSEDETRAWRTCLRIGKAEADKLWQSYYEGSTGGEGQSGSKPKLKKKQRKAVSPPPENPQDKRGGPPPGPDGDGDSSGPSSRARILTGLWERALRELAH